MQKIFLLVFIGLIFSIKSIGYNVSTGPNWTPSSKIYSSTTASEGLIKYFLNFATIGYCYNGEYEKGNCCNSVLGTDWELVGSGKETFYSYNFIVFKSKKFKKIVVALPGTRGKLQFLDEILNSGLQSYKFLSSIKMVDYFLDRAERIQKKVFDTIDSAKESGYQIIFVGHSLGGAVASILAFYGVNKGKINKSQNNIILITYGQPQTGNENFVDAVMKACTKVFRIVRDRDIVVNHAAIDIPIFNDSQHLGGMVLLNKDMTNFENCPYNYRETKEFKGTKCQMTKTDIDLKDLTYHSYLAGNKELSKKCS